MKSSKSLLAFVVLVLLLLVNPRHSVAREHTVDELKQGLRSDSARERESAAIELRKQGPPPVDAVRALLLAARVEADQDALTQMILSLGDTGLMEALGLIQTHAQSPVRALRIAGRKALKAWLVRNQLLDEDADLPDPPHRFYEAPLRAPPGRPAAHALSVWESFFAGGVTHPLSAVSPPAYDPPAPHGVPAGYGVERVPRRGLVVAGGSIWGASYVASIIVGLEGVTAGNLGAAALFIPVAGPFLAVDTSLPKNERTSLGGALRIAGGILQIAGSGLLVAGLTATKPRLVHTPTSMPEVSIGPAGAAFTWVF